MTKHIWCEVCEGSKAPLFAVKDATGKHYICKNCIEKWKQTQSIKDAKEVHKIINQIAAGRVKDEQAN